MKILDYSPLNEYLNKKATKKNATLEQIKDIIQGIVLFALGMITMYLAAFCC